jgi:mRNA interferase MazF
MNESESGLTIVVPITSTLRPVRSHIRLQPPEGGVTVESAIQCEQIRAMSGDRLVTQLGRVGTETMNTVERVLGLILELA